MCGPVTRIFCGSSRYSRARTCTTPSVATTSLALPQPARRASASRGRARRIGARGCSRPGRPGWPMLRRRVRSRRGIVLIAGAFVASLVLAACGEESVNVADKPGTPEHAGAELFYSHCSGCHTLDPSGAQGSATKVRDRERVDGPNFNQRKETVGQVLYAIRNGGFSGAIMPENIVTGKQAEVVARYLAKYSGKDASTPPAPQSPQNAGG